MASPGELVHVIAEVLGIPEPTVTVHDRNLAVAGLRKKGGRGTSAAKMTLADAAALLTSILTAPPNVSQSAQFTKWYSELAAVATPPGPHMIPSIAEAEFGQCDRDAWQDAMAIPHLAALGKKHTFANALAALLADSGLLRNADYSQVRVSLYGPIPEAMIEVLVPSLDNGTFRQSVLYRDREIPTVGTADTLRTTADYLDRKYGDLNTITVQRRTSVHLPSIATIATAVL